MRKLDGTTLNGKKIRLIDVRYVSNAMQLKVAHLHLKRNSAVEQCLLGTCKSVWFWAKLNNEEKK